jgi:hypothetical protein
MHIAWRTVETAAAAERLDSALGNILGKPQRGLAERAA